MTMSRRVTVGAAIAGGAAIALTAWGAARLIEHLVAPAPAPSSAPVAATAAVSVPHIIATLYYATRDGETLAAVKREVPLAEGVRAQGRQILETQLEAAPAPYVSTTPTGTKVRAFYVTDQGDAFVDMSADVSTGHPGGSTAERLTVYAIVNAITTNLSSVHRVQILIDGKEVDTLAGHVDLRRPFERDTSLVSPK